MKSILTIEPGQEWSVDLFRPEDANRVVSLFLDVYGKNYPVRTYLDPDLLTEANRNHSVISSVARTPRGDIVGHNALFNSAPYTGVFESGAGLVHRDYRGGKNIFTQMVAHGLELGGSSFGVETAFGEPVCNHPFSQKLCNRMGFVTRAVEISLMPASAYSREKSATGRVTTLLDFKTLSPKPCTVYVPDPFKDLFPVFYHQMDDERTFLAADGPLPDVPTRLDTQTFPFAQVARVAVTETGRDFSPTIAAEEIRLTESGIRVIQVWLPTGSPCVGEAAGILRQRGYFLGGVLPRWFDVDGLLMEKVLDPPDWDGMVLEFDRGRELRDLVRNEWQAADAITRKEAP